MERRGVLRLLALGVACVWPLVRAAEERGWFGFAVPVDVEGLSLNPTLRAAKIESVVSLSPAAAGGLNAGDLIAEVQGFVIAGAKAEVLRRAMHKAVGETLRLVVKRGSLPPRIVTLKAAAKPPGTWSGAAVTSLTRWPEANLFTGSVSDTKAGLGRSGTKYVPLQLIAILVATATAEPDGA